MTYSGPRLTREEHRLARALQCADVLRSHGATSAEAAALGRVPAGVKLVASHVERNMGAPFRPPSPETWALVVGLLREDERRARLAGETPARIMGRL